MGAYWRAALFRTGLPHGGAKRRAIVMFNVWGFLLGIAAVWLYAATNNRIQEFSKRLGTDLVT